MSSASGRRRLARGLALVGGAVVGALASAPAGDAVILTDLSYEQGSACTVYGTRSSPMWDGIYQERTFDPGHPEDFVSQSSVRIEGACAAAITVHDDDTRCEEGQTGGCFSTGERTTAVKNSITADGSADVYTFALRYEPGWPEVASPGYCIQWEMKQENNIGERAGTNNLVLDCVDNMHGLTVRGGDIDAVRTNVTATCSAGPFVPDAWYAFIIRIRWSRAGDGSVEAYRNGVKFCDVSNIDTVFDAALPGDLDAWDPDIRVQHGLYRTGVTEGTARFYSDAVALHDTVCNAKRFLSWTADQEPACPAHTLLVSAFANRARPAGLSGRTLAGTAYVFVNPPTDVARARFYLDDPRMQGAPRTVEKLEPYDFAGGAVSAANPFDTRTVSDGSHTVTAALDRSAGGTEVVSATFAVKNGRPPGP